MSRKQVVTHDSSAGAAPARAAKPKTSRVKSAKHTKSAAAGVTSAPEVSDFAGPVDQIEIVENVIVPEPAAAAISENTHEEIARIAYGYWLERGCAGGNPIEDWIRAEGEYRRRIAV